MGGGELVGVKGDRLPVANKGVVVVSISCRLHGVPGRFLTPNLCRVQAT